MLTCPCQPYTDGEPSIECAQITELSGVPTRMVPAFCFTYINNAKYRDRWNRIGGPGRPASPELPGPRVLRLNVPPVPQLPAKERQALADKLTALTESKHIAENLAMYWGVLDAWAAADCETRDDNEQAFALQFCRGGCLDGICRKKCGRYHIAKDACQCGPCGEARRSIPLAIRAVMASESCPGMKW